METLIPIKTKRLSYHQCKNPYDYVTQEEWTETPPDFIITIFHSSGSYNVCSTFDTLRRWFGDPANTFARWIKRPDVVSMDEVGRGGQPDFKRLYVKLFEGEFLVRDEYIQMIINGTLTQGRFAAPEVGIERVGNLQGTFGIGQLHGQSPGYRIYKLNVAGDPDTSTFKFIPDATLSQICKQMDDLTLSNFIQTSRHNMIICGKVLSDRRQGIAMIESQILEQAPEMFTIEKYEGVSVSIVYVFESIAGKYSLSQDLIYPIDTDDVIEWPLPNVLFVEYTETEPNHIVVKREAISFIDHELIHKLATNLYMQEYHLSG